MRTLRRRLSATLGSATFGAVAVVVATATIAACGGDDPEDGFVADADSICTDAAREQAELALADGGSVSRRATADRMSALAESGDRALERFEGLAPPDDSADEWDAFLDNRREAVALIEARGEAALQGDAEGADQAARELDGLLDQRDALAEQLGLRACARILPAEDEERVREAVELASVSGDGELVCGEVIASAYIEEQFGGSVERCAQVQRRAQTAESVDFRDVYGVAGVLATAEVDLSGGAVDGGSATLQLAYEDGDYRIFDVATSSSTGK